MILAITTYCTKSYTFALKRQIPLTIAALRYAGFDKAVFIMAGDMSKEVSDAFKLYRDALAPLSIECHLLKMPHLVDNSNQEHQQASNIAISRMQGAAWAKARELDADELWSLESDILPQARVLRVMRGVVQMDDWYDVVMCTYPNDGFLGGHGSPHNWIAPNVYDDERKISEEVKKLMEQKKAREDALRKDGKQPTPEDIKQWQVLDRMIKEQPAKGNVFQLNANGWRPRGWFEHAYPGIGLGAVLPTMWVGLGCTYFSRKALSMASFDGYNGGGTQDLYLCWRVFHPGGIRLAVTSHALCSHVKRRAVKVPGKKAPKVETYLLAARHELGGESHGHLRVDRVPFQEV